MSADDRDQSKERHVSNLITHAETELTRAGLFDADSDYGGMIGEAALAIVTVFSGQGHSGMSADLTTDIVTRLMRFEPLTPLTNDPSEWTNVSEQSGSELWQSKRRPDAFSCDAGMTHYLLADPDVMIHSERVGG